MKKSKRFWILSAVLAVALGACTVVYAAGGIFADETQPEAPNQLKASQDEKISEVEPETAKLQPIAKSGTKAEEILNALLAEREMTEREIKDYNVIPDEIKNLTYEEARALEKELYDELYPGGVAGPWLGTEEQMKKIDLYCQYESYANAIAQKNDLSKIRWQALYNDAFEMKLFSTGALEDMTQADIERLPRYVKSHKSRLAFAELALTVLEDIKEDAMTGDYQKALDVIATIRTHLKKVANFGNGDFELYSQEDYEGFLAQYKAGKSALEVFPS